MNLYLALDRADAFRRLEQDLSRIEADLGKLVAHEPFPEYPDLDALDEEIRAWMSAHAARTERIAELVRMRLEVLQMLRRMLVETR